MELVAVWDLLLGGQVLCARLKHWLMCPFLLTPHCLGVTSILEPGGQEIPVPAWVSLRTLCAQHRE